MSGRLPVLTIIVSLLGLLPSVAQAESVLIFSPAGREGHGWLFGAAGVTGVECWLVFPMHVLGDRKRDAQVPFEFQDKRGKRGESGTPLGVADVPASLEVMGKFADLGFARVSSGRIQGDCLSRLGLDTYAYGMITRSRTRLALQSLLPTSYGVIAVNVTRSGTADLKHRLVLEAESEAETSAYFKGGLSGAVAQVTRESGVYPVAMVTNVDPKLGTAWAVRFDAIANAFPRVKAAIGRRDADAVTETNKSNGSFPVGSYRAITLSPGIGPGSLASPESCWQAAPQGGMRNVALVSKKLRLPEGGVAIVAERRRDCGSDAIPIGIDVSRDNGKTWSRVTECVLPAEKTQVSCGVSRRGALLLRMVFSTRRLGLNALYLK